MGLDTPETCRGWRNIQRISCASSLFFFTRGFCTLKPTQVLSWSHFCLRELHHLLTRMFLFLLSWIMMSGLWLGMVVSVRTFWFHNMVTLPSWLVSADFGTWSYKCSLSNITPISLHMLKCSWAHNISRLFMYCSFVNTGNADIVEFHNIIKLFTESAFIIIIIIIIIIVLEMRHYELSHEVYEQEICGRLPGISKTVLVLG
jgi:hypothetical protein